MKNHTLEVIVMHRGHEGKHFFGTAKVGEKGQIVIPKDARKIFNIKPGDTVILLGDESKGMAIMKSSKMKEFAFKTMASFGGFDSSRSKK